MVGLYQIPAGNVIGFMFVPLQHERHAKLYRSHYKRLCLSLSHHLASYLVYNKTESCYHQLCNHASFCHTSLSRPAWCHTHMLTPFSIPILLCTILVTFLENLQHSLHLSNLPIGQNVVSKPQSSPCITYTYVHALQSVVIALVHVAMVIYLL